MPFFLTVRARWKPDTFPVHDVFVLTCLALINARTGRYVADFTQDPVLIGLVSFKN
jgi:hypothetical protein